MSNTIDKGTISSLKNGGTEAEVIPGAAKAAVSVPLIVPESLKNKLTAGTEVIYAMFEDNTGIILCRADGKYS